MLVDLANASVADGHHVSVCVTRADLTLARDLHPSIEVLVLARKRRFEWRAAMRLRDFAKRADVLHVHMRHTLTLILLLRMLRLLPVPLVFHDHYGTIESDTAVPIWFRVGHRLVDHYVGVYDKLSEWAREAGMPASRVTTIENAIDLTRFATTTRNSLREELGIPSTVLLGLVVSTIRPDKSIETLIDAVAATTRRSQLHIAIAGDEKDPAYARDCHAHTARAGLGSSITYLGPRTDIPQILPGCDFAALSSHTESGPLVLIEYLAAGRPIVSTVVGDIGHRLASLGVEGFVPARDPSAFAAALDTLVAQSPYERQQRGLRGRQVLTNNWDIRALMPRWYEVYDAARAEYTRGSR